MKKTEFNNTGEPSSFEASAKRLYVSIGLPKNSQNVMKEKTSMSLPKSADCIQNDSFTIYKRFFGYNTLWFVLSLCKSPEVLDLLSVCRLQRLTVSGK